MNYNKYNSLVWHIFEGYHIPRKAKKQIIRNKLNKSKRLLEFKKGNFDFCPKCGCKEFKHIHHDVEFPEIWIETKCISCGYHVGGADNSSFELFHENMSISEFKSINNLKI